MITSSQKPAPAPGQKSDTPEEPFDVFIIGGGINGAGIARDAAGRGYRVCLAEMNDLASGTSSWSTKLIHGGLRYLEYYEFRLVREALKEREVLWRLAPHIIWPLRFVLPHRKAMRPAWLLRLGLFLYDHIGGRKRLPATKVLDLRHDPAGKPLKEGFSKAFEYSDCWVNDARLVVLNAQDATMRGAQIYTRTKVTHLARYQGLWQISLQEQGSGKTRTLKARLVVNAAGPWVDRVLGEALQRNDAQNVRLVQGSHIVIKQKFPGSRAYFFQNDDRRIFFAIPYEEGTTLIGTTDRDYEGEPGNAAITEGEIDYLCAAASAYFKEPVRREDIVWSYSGVRPLYDDGATEAQEATRDYVLKMEGKGEEAKLINIFGGKLTTYRRLAEAAMDKIAEAIGAKGAAWTRDEPLPGGNFPVTGYEEEVARLMQDYSFLQEPHAKRLVRLYGTCARALLGKARCLEDLGESFGADLTEAEVHYLVTHEWAKTAEDVLWRRTKRGLVIRDEAAISRLESLIRALVKAQPS